MDKDIEKTAFIVGSRGLYKYKRMPKELVKAPATFSRLMKSCLGDQNMEMLILYLDDILIFAPTFGVMLDRLAMVFRKYKDYGRN